MRVVKEHGGWQANESGSSLQQVWLQYAGWDVCTTDTVLFGSDFLQK